MFWAKHRRLILRLVYIAFFGHAFIWYSLGYTGVGHLGFGELFATMRSGLVTAGTVFTLLAFIHALFFGGLFCGWFCHWGITQDFASWLFKKFGIKHPMFNFNSKLLPWLWFFVLIGQVVIFWIYNGLPTSFSMELGATPVWSGVPRSIFMICITLIVSCFLTVLLFGERAFCRSVCTFRLWFSWFEKLSFHKLRQTKECSACQDECTEICPMGLEVAKEIKTLGLIKNQECIKCYNCIKACPNEVIKVGFLKNDFEKPGEQIVPPSDLHPTIPWLQVSIAAIILVLFCEHIGGNMSLGLGLILGYLIIQFLKTKKISWVTGIFLATLPFYYYHATDLNDFTSTLKGLALITVFIILVKLLGVKPEHSFSKEKSSAAKVPTPLLVIFLSAAILLGGAEVFYSMQISKGTAAYGAKDMKLYTEIMEKYGRAHTNPASLHFTLGEAYFSLENIEKATENYKKSLDLNYNLEVAEGILNNLIYQGYLQEAQTLALDLKEKFPADKYHFDIAYGYTKLHLGDEEEAIEVFEKAVKAEDVPTSVVHTLAELKLQDKKFSEAKSLLLSHLARDPSRLAPILATTYAQTGELEKGKSLLEKTIKTDWDNMYMPLSIIYLQNGEAYEAEKIYRKAISKDPKNYTAFYYLGLCLAEQNKLRDAIEAWQIIPKDFDAYEAAQENILNANLMLR